MEQDEELKQKKETRGLKNLRRTNIDSSPRWKCENCKCLRYSPCYCKKKRIKK